MNQSARVPLHSASPPEPSHPLIDAIRARAGQPQTTTTTSNRVVLPERPVKQQPSSASSTSSLTQNDGQVIVRRYIVHPDGTKSEVPPQDILVNQSSDSAVESAITTPHDAFGPTFVEAPFFQNSLPPEDRRKRRQAIAQRSQTYPVFIKRMGRLVKVLRNNQKMRVEQNVARKEVRCCVVLG